LNYKHTVGLHLHLSTTLCDMAETARALGLKTFQFFLVRELKQKYITVNREETNAFVKIRQEHFSTLYLHSSYWINACTADQSIFALSKRLFQKELDAVVALELNYLVLHAGSAKGQSVTPEDPYGIKKGIEQLAKLLNELCKQYPTVQLLLENTAFGKNTIGSNLADFVLLRSFLDFPERVGYCLDTAHAFAYGYALDPLDDFIKIVDESLGLENIKLIHFNDSVLRFGCMQDMHAFPGEGKIGKDAMANLLNHPVFAPLPKIIEYPDGDLEEILQKVKNIEKGVV